MAVFPTINGTVRVQRPWAYRTEYRTQRNDMPHGYRYSYADRTSGMRPMRLEYHSITDADLTTLRDFMAARKGQLESFDLVHPETGVTIVSRFATDEFEVRHISPNVHAVTIELIEVPA